MVAYNFKKQFVEKILDLSKRHTIRRIGKREHAKPGDKLQLYYGQRTKQCRKIADAVCMARLRLRINVGETEFLGIWTISRTGAVDAVPKHSWPAFAKRDGFESIADMHAFWLASHGVGMFEGFLIQWGENIKKTIYAEDVDCWRTGKSRTVSAWLDLAESQLMQHGAKNVLKSTGTNETGATTFMFAFELNDQKYNLVWPTLPTRSHSESAERAARIQAVTSLYHEVKNCCVVGNRYGKGTGFFAYQMLPDGRTVRQLAAPELVSTIAGYLT